jgi:uncharacterized membrane protein
MAARARWAAIVLAGLAWAGLSLWLLFRAPASPWSTVAERLYLVEHVAIHLALACSFGLTLRQGSRPLISRLAERVHGSLTPAKVRYTRQVTVAWTIYFVGMAVVSVILFATLPFAAWAVYAHVATPLALVAMFVGEYTLRFRLHPEFERARVRDMIRAYTHARRAGTSTATPPPAAPRS